MNKYMEALKTWGMDTVEVEVEILDIATTVKISRKYLEAHPNKIWLPQYGRTVKL